VENPSTIGEIAYDYGNELRDYTVYLEENGVYTPYLVLTDNYNSTGTALLMRQELLPDMVFSQREELQTFGFNYYDDCLIDKFLNNDFLARFTSETQNLLLDTYVTITAIRSSNSTNRDVLDISRKVFIPSYTEIGLSSSSSASVEGEPLKYFDSMERRLAYRDGLARNWWLRTAYTSGTNLVCVMVYDATFDYAMVNYTLGVRPEFCVNPNVPVTKSDVIVPGKSVYVIDYNLLEQGLPPLLVVKEPTRYMITVTANSTSLGRIWGGDGLRQAGNYVDVDAWPNDGYRFEGWFEGGKLLSTEARYRFPVERSMALEARFAIIDNAHKLTLVASEGGGVSRDEGNYPSGRKIQLTATEHEGYRFVGWRSTGGVIEEVTPIGIYFIMPDHDVTVYADFAKN
jgi:hypothetical protein